MFAESQRIETAARLAMGNFEYPTDTRRTRIWTSYAMVICLSAAVVVGVIAAVTNG